MSVSFPKNLESAIESLAGLTSEQRSQLLSALKSIKPALLSKDIVKQLKNKVDIDLAKLQQIVEVIMLLYRMQESAKIDSDQVAKDLVDRFSANKDSESQEANSEYSKLQEYLIELLTLDSGIKFSSKASSLLVEHESFYTGSQIITDIRPVFSSGSDPSPETCLLIHNLNISVGGSKKDKVFIALDSRDLRDLKKEIDRALDKESKLITSMEEKGINFIQIGQ